MISSSSFGLQFQVVNFVVWEEAIITLNFLQE